MTYTARDRAAYAQAIHDYEQSTLWRDRAHTYRRTHGIHCDACGRRGIDVHHRSYEYAFTGAEPDTDLRGLCRPCHDQVHALTPTHGGTLPLDAATDHVIALARHEHTPRHPHQPQRRRHRTPWFSGVAALVLLLYTLAALADYWR